MFKEIQVPLQFVHQMWAKRKIETDSARQEFLTSRALVAEKYVRAMEFHIGEQLKLKQASQARCMQHRIVATQCRFRRHWVVEEWIRQFVVCSHPKQRYMSLLLRGASKAGKTSMAKSLFEEGTALEVNCQGCSPDLPSLRAFDRERHVAIIWDEIDEKQVLANKLVFQAGAQMITLGQSKCNQYSYSVYLHGVAMILLSNTFRMPHATRPSTLTSIEADWLGKNIVEAELPEGETWYEGDDILTVPPAARDPPPPPCVLDIRADSCGSQETQSPCSGGLWFV